MVSEDAEVAIGEAVLPSSGSNPLAGDVEWLAGTTFDDADSRWTTVGETGRADGDESAAVDALVAVGARYGFRTHDGACGVAVEIVAAGAVAAGLGRLIVGFNGWAATLAALGIVGIGLDNRGGVVGAKFATDDRGETAAGASMVTRCELPAAIAADLEGCCGELAAGGPTKAVVGFNAGVDGEGTVVAATVGGFVPNRAEFAGAGCDGAANVTRGYNENFGMASLPSGDLAALATAPGAGASVDGLLAATSGALVAGTGDGVAVVGLTGATTAGVNAAVGGAFGVVAATAGGGSTLGWTGNVATVGEATEGAGFEPGKKLTWFAAGGVSAGDLNSQADALGRTAFTVGLAGIGLVATSVAAGVGATGELVPAEVAKVDAVGNAGEAGEAAGVTGFAGLASVAGVFPVGVALAVAWIDGGATRGTTGIGESRLKSGVVLRASAVADRGGVNTLAGDSLGLAALATVVAGVPAGTVFIGGGTFFAASCADERAEVGAGTRFPKWGNGFHLHQLPFEPGSPGCGADFDGV